MAALQRRRLPPRAADPAALSGRPRRRNAAGIDVGIVSTYRDNARQRQIFAQGRAKPGKIATNARGDQSWRDYRPAFDFANLKHGEIDCGRDLVGRFLENRCPADIVSAVGGAQVATKPLVMAKGCLVSD